VSWPFVKSDEVCANNVRREWERCVAHTSTYWWRRCGSCGCTVCRGASDKRVSALGARADMRTYSATTANTLGGRDVDYVQDLYYFTAMLHDALSGTTVSRSCNECTQCSSGVLQFSPPDDNAPISCGAWLNCRLKQASAAHEDTLCTDVANDTSAECCVVPVRVSQFLWPYLALFPRYSISTTNNGAPL